MPKFNLARELKRKSLWFLLAIVGVVLDFATKQWANNSLEFAQSVEVLPFLDWTLIYNEGAAFSFLADHGGWQRYFFTFISFAASIFLSIWILRTKFNEYLLLTGLTLILSGAVGNLIDRFFLGHVIDFIHVNYQSFNWPVFNVADIFVSVGVVFILLASIFEAKKDKEL